MKALLPLLQRLDKTMQILSSSTKPTVSQLFPEALALWEMADALSKSDSTVTREFASKFRDELNERFYLKETAILFECAELLDPVVARAKMREEGSIDVMRGVRDALADSFFQNASDKDEDTGPDIFGDLHTHPKAGMNSDFRAEFGKYLKEVRDMTGDPECLTWWRANCERFPLVARSSAESERLFSVGAYIVNRWRTRLSGPHAEKLILLSKQLRRQPHCSDDDDQLAPESDVE